MRIVLIGFGVVGQAVAGMLREQGEGLARKYGLEAKVVAVADSGGGAIDRLGLDATTLLAHKRAGKGLASLPGHGVKQTPAEIVAAVDADVVVESSPSNLKNPAPAMANLLAALRTGKHVVCVNKAPLATAMPALLESAKYNRVQFRFSGSVGAATPILHTARRVGQGDTITRVRAIINGTTNFILSRMAERDEPFDAALQEAIRLGYAETDPSNDIDGVDTAMKLVILANHAMDMRAAYSDVTVHGIRGLDIARVRAAKAAGKAVKLIAGIENGQLTVAPTEVEADSALNVSGSLNAACFTLANSGDVTVVGRGAGGPQTATAIVRDLIDIWKEGF